MLAKKYKLTTVEIKDLFSKKERSFFSFKNTRNELFDIKYFSNPEIKENKYGVILSGKTFKKAVERNKIKRQIYSLIEKLEEKKGSFVLIYPKKIITNTTFQDLQKELYNVLNNNLNNYV
ncbi:MAG: Ribonuclease protein component [Patescibacteria group bacterium]|nr:Ribonuclease protein component [Patescibacteria group bacterium]